MELKPADGTMSITLGNLLIVPYGIETGNDISPHAEAALLIVPYGIETW